MSHKFTDDQRFLIDRMTEGFSLISTPNLSHETRYSIRRERNGRFILPANISSKTVKSLMSHGLLMEYPTRPSDPEGQKRYILNTCKLAEMKKAKVRAQWTVELHCDCPSCGKYVDLMEADDFWLDHTSLDIPQHDTEYTDNMDVFCPECGHEFAVCCEW